MDESNFHKINVIILFTWQTPSWLWDCVLSSQKESLGCHRKICIIIYRQPVSYCLEQLFSNRAFRLYYIIKLQQRGISVPQPTFSRAWSKKKNICNIYTKSSRHFEEWLWSPKQQGDAGFFVHERFYDNEIIDSRSIRMFQMFKSWWNKIFKHEYSSIFSFKKNMVMKILIANHIYIALQLQWRFPRPLLTHGVLSLQTELTTSPSWSTWRRWADMRKTCTSTR